MQGFVWFQEETQGFRDGNYAKRFVITRPLAGLQYFLEEPLDPDLFKSIAASSNFEHGIKVSDIGGWVFGGNIVAESATMQPAIRFREIVLFPIKLKLLAPQSSTDLLFCLENEEERERWHQAIQELLLSLTYVRSSVSLDVLPWPSLAKTGESLQLCEDQLSSKMLQSFLQYLKLSEQSRPACLRMCLVSAGLGDRHVELLSKILTMYSSTLQSICLAENYLTEKGVKALSSSLALCSQVSALDLSNNLIGDESTEQLCTVLRAMPRLTILNLSRNRLTEVSAAVLHKRVLNYRSRLQHLDLSYNQLGDELGSVLCELLQTIPPCLVQANFSYCGLTDKSCGAIAKCVAGCSTLRHLTLEGTFLEPGTMRHLMVSTMKHFELHRNEQNESLVVRYGGTLHDLQSTVGLSYKALKPALAELSDVALVKDLHVIRPFSSVKPGMLVCFRLRMVSFIERIEEVLIYLSQELRCSTDQLPIISYTANINDNPDQESCDRLCFLMFGVISDAYELTARLLKMIKESHVLLRMLGVRSAYLEYHAAASSGHSSVISENIAIQKSGFGGSGATDTLVPPLGDLNVYTSMPVATTVGFKHERWLDAEDGELPREAGAERFVFSRYDSEAQLADDPTVSNMQEVNSSFFVQDRNNREKLILAVRTLHKSKDISSSVAKFWEGVLGNRKFRAFAEVELVKAMRLNWIELVDMVPTLVVSEKVAHLNGDEVQLLKSLLSSSVVNLHVFPAVCERQLLYDAMFSRDLFRVQTILKLLDGHTGGHAAVWGQKLANEISILQKTWLNLKTSVRKFADLRLVEEYLLNCGRVGYTGPEMFEAVDLRQNVVSHAVERGDKKAVEELPRVKFRALMTNLLISRDVNALRVKLQAVQDSYHDFNEFSALPEYQVASSLVEQYERNQVRLSSAIQSRGIEELDAAIATAAYSYFYHADIEKTLRVMNDVSRNPALLMRRIVNGLRNSVMSEVEAGFEDLNKMGISHHALDTIICSKIYAIKSRNNQESSKMLRKASTTKQEQLVSELLAHNDIVQLNKLFNGRGTGKLVVSFPTAFARDQWFEKLRDVCLGKRGDAEPGSASTSNREVVLTGTFEKAARSTTGHYRGWRRRYFILHPRSIVYYTKPGGEQKGYMQVVGGSVRIMDPEELVTTSKGEQIYSNRLYCLEVEEGRDVSQTISAELYSEVRRIVRMAKIGKIEQLLQQGIRFKSARLLQRMLSVAHEMEVMLDFKLAFDAKQCLSELKEQSIIKELHLAKLHVPKRHDLEELIKLSKEYNIDLNLPSLVCIDALLKRSDIELELLRTNGQLVRNQLADFVRSMRKLNRLDWSQPSVQKHKHAFVLLFVRYVMRVLTDWLQLGRGRAEVHRALRRALLVCANYHVETESMDLMRLALQFGATVEVKDVDAVANGDREDSASAQEHGSRNMAEWEQPSASREFMKGVDTSNSSNGSSDMQSFIEELHVSHYVLSLTPQHALNKCPKLRDAYNLKKKRERGTFAMFIGQKKGVVIDELVHSVETLKTSLLEPDASSSLLHDAQLGSEVFCIVQVLMQDKPLSSLAKPSKSKIAKSTERSEINVLADLLTFLHSNSTGDIVDEVFFQICKQLTNNGDPLSRGKGWLLLSVLLHCIYPSLPCLPYIRYFVEEQVRTMKVAYISDNQKSNDHIAAQQSGVETLLYAMRAARYSLALLNQEGGSGQYQNVLSPQNEHFRLLLDCIWSQREIDIQVVAMTGQIAQLRLPFSQLSSPCVLLGLIYQTLVPLDAQIYYAHQQSSMVASSGAPNNESVDYIEEQLMQEYDVLFDINYQPPSRLSLAKSIKLSKRTHIPIYDDDVVIQEALLFSQGFALYRVDDTALDGDEHSVNVQRLAVQPFGSCLVNWHVDLQYEVLNSLVNSLVPDQHHIVSVTSTTSRTFVLRSVIMDPSVHHFSCDFELLGVEFGAYEYNPRLQALKQWLASDLMRYTKTADNAVVGRLDSLLLREKAGDRLLLPFDFFKLDLLFAEECRYVNSRLALLTDEHFHYLLSMQLALSWCDDTYRHTRTNVDGGDLQLVNNTASTASCYFTMPVKDIHRANAQRISRIKSVRDSLRREQGDEGVESLNTSDSDESDANSNPDEDEENEDEILSLQRKFHALQMGRSKYSPKRSNIRKRFSEGDSGDDSDPEAEGDAKRSDGQGDSWIPHPILPDQPLTKDDLQHLRQILEELGVEVADPTQAASSEGNAGTAQGKAYIDVLWQGMASFHAIVRESGLSIDSPFFRYLLKRSYHDYLTSVTGYYGMHFTEVSLTDLYLEDNLRFESSELTAFVDSFSAPQSVLLAISSYGLYLCDTETWSVQFYAPLFDVQHFELLSYGQHSAANSKARPHSAASQALLKLFISGLHISLVSKESDMKATVTCLEQHTLSALHVSCSLSEANWFSLAPVLDEETSVAALDSDEQMVVHRLAACTNVYKAPRVKTPSAAHSAMLQLFVQRYCPLLPAPRTMEVLPLALSTDSQRVFKPLLNNRQILLQQRLESLQRDLTLSSLATQSRYEKSQEHMHKRNELSKLGGGYSDDEDEEVESVKLLDADGVRDRNSVRKKRTARSVYGDPALTSQAKAGKVDADRVLSSIVGVMSHQGHRFRKREQDSGGGSYQHTGSLYMAANQASGNGTLVNIPVRTQGVVHVPSQHRSDQDSATRGHSKPRFSPFSPAKQMHAAKSLSYLPAQAAESTTSAGHTAAALQLERVDFVLAAYYEKTARDQAGQQRRRLADLAELEESLADGGTESLV